MPSTFNSPTTAPFPRYRWPPTSDAGSTREIAEETPIAIVHNGTTMAVMMATPADLEDFAIGFSLTEGAIQSLADVESVEILQQEDGIEARLWLAPAAAERLATRRRRMAGPTGCGLCGVESLAAAGRAPPAVRGRLQLSPHDLLHAMGQLEEGQHIGRRTRAVHAAALWRAGAVTALREDVGRHNALDKLAGALLRGSAQRDGVVLLTSRVSVEMVQKTAWLGAPILCAVSAPTALAIRQAETAGITLVAICRRDGFEVFTHPHRITRSA